MNEVPPPIPKEHEDLPSAKLPFDPNNPGFFTKTFFIFVLIILSISHICSNIEIKVKSEHDVNIANKNGRFEFKVLNY